MFRIAAADIAGSRFEGAIFSGRSLDEAAVIGSHIEKSPRGFILGERAEAFDWFGEGNRFTEDTVLTAALIEWLLDGGSADQTFRRWIRAYPHRGYGKHTQQWGLSNWVPPRSVGSTAAIRVIPIAYAFQKESMVREVARFTARLTHIAGSAINGAEAVALAVFLARKGVSSAEVQTVLTNEFGYDFSQSTDEIRETPRPFTTNCCYTVPQAVLAACESDSYEEGVRRAISLGGDTHTTAVIAGSLAAAWHGFDPQLRNRTRQHLPVELERLFVRFNNRFTH